MTLLGIGCIDVGRVAAPGKRECSFERLVLLETVSLEGFEPAIERDKDVLELSGKDRKQYVALLRRRKYSENTIRRRLVTLGLLYRLREERRADKGNE